MEWKRGSSSRFRRISSGIMGVSFREGGPDKVLT